MPATASAQFSDGSPPALIGRMHDQQRAARHREQAELQRPLSRMTLDYARMKKTIGDETGLSFSMDASVTTQMGVRGGTVNALQAMFTPNVNWKAIRHPAWGTGSIQFDYLAAQYWSAASAAELAANLALNSPINAYPANSRFFRQVSYSDALPGEWIAVTLGSIRSPALTAMPTPTTSRRASCPTRCRRTAARTIRKRASAPTPSSRFAMDVGAQCRRASVRDVGRELKLDWHTVKTLEKPVQQDGARDGLQAARGRAEKLASSRWPQPVAKTHSRRDIGNRGHRQTG
jgi:hypothetical protein